MDKPQVSVIIPTYQDWEALSKCLDAISFQTFPLEAFEVIVVINEAKTSHPCIDKYPYKLHIIHEPIHGSYSARNTGVINAKGEILAFTDSDCIPDTNWIMQGVKKLSTLAQDRVTGPVELFFTGKKPNTYDLIELLYGFNQIDNVKNGSSVTANLFVWKSVFSEVGIFNAEMKSGGDHEWNIRATKMGFTLAYYPEIIVRHPTRNSYSALRKKAKRIVGGKYELIKKDKVAICKLFLYGFIPSGKDWVYIKSRPEISSYYLKGKIYIFKYLLNVERSLELVKLIFGKSANRI